MDAGLVHLVETIVVKVLVAEYYKQPAINYMINH